MNVNFTRCLRGLFALVCTLLLYLHLQAQEKASVSGMVRDEKGSALPGVTVSARNNSNSYTKGVLTDEKGMFRFAELPEGGPYTFTFSFIGYETQTLGTYQLKAGNNLSLLVKLKVTSTKENTPA